MHGKDFAEVGLPRLELEVPYLYGVLQAELVAVNLGEGGEEIGAAEQHLALVADASANEEVFGDIHQVVVGDDGGVLLRAV